jgi:hypothetical protein
LEKVARAVKDYIRLIKRTLEINQIKDGFLEE